jgi:transcription elongation factor Elf1
LLVKRRRKKNKTPNSYSSSEDETKRISAKRTCVGKKSWKKHPRTLNVNELQKKKKKRTPPTSHDSDSDYAITSDSSFQVKSRHNRTPKKLARRPQEVDEDLSSEDEDDVSSMLYACDFPKIFITQVTKEQITKRGILKKRNRVYNKVNACPYCGELKVNFDKHILNVHKGETDVKKLLDLEPRSKERIELVEKLLAKGNHEHNVKTINLKRGLFIPKRRPSARKAQGKKINWSVSDYGPCPGCTLWMKKSLLARHTSHCASHKQNHQMKMSSSEILLQSDITAGRVDRKASDDLVKEVYKIMKNDDISRIAKSDPLIVQAGNGVLMRNIGNKAMRRYYASSVMRLLARLLLELRKLQVDEHAKETLCFYDALTTSQYTNFVDAVFQVCGPLDIPEDEDNEEDLQAPSNAIKLSYDIGRLCHAKIYQAMDDPDRERGEAHRKDTKRFHERFAQNWFVDVKKKARHVLKQRKMNKKLELPVAQDIVKLATHLKDSLESAKRPETPDEMRSLQLNVLARLISYNRRRPGEVQSLR